MSVETIVIITCAYFVAAFVKGATGLGFSTFALPILALGLGLKSAMPLVIIPSLISNAIVMRQAGHFGETIRRFWLMFLATIPGLLLGLAVLDLIDSLIAGAVLGVVLIGYGAVTLFRPGRPMPDALGRKLAPVSGFLTGLVNGMTGSQVMPVLPFLLALRLDPRRFIQAINISFSLSSVIMAVGLAKLGPMTTRIDLDLAAGADTCLCRHQDRRHRATANGCRHVPPSGSADADRFRRCAGQQDCPGLALAL